ncbi:type III pantothenate kinase [Anaerorhabdus furcosa]|uniref:Type III pantothenate kinase n=1 Tax=Anaerorhabdus furcosa TaxID=118967 RepID=A0A1T4K191_9FIRM|nr:type III pantothenate kinase [Anaerorhabdus furcosa]SJZ36174.1 type III pantothenate kinase [Anaerorhabdus furcosa]
MLLTIDVGNTNITMGIFDEDTLVGNFRLTTKTPRTSDEYGICLSTLLAKYNIDSEQIEDVIISSVVPKVMYSLNSCIIKYLNRTPIIIGPGVKTGIQVNSDNPREVGADRIVNVAAAYHTYHQPCLIIDFGTATTFDYVSEKGVFEYTVISPGIEISAQALWNQTAKLPEIEIKKPNQILSKNTINGMQSGIVFGYIGQVEYIVKQMLKELGRKDVKVIATGGLGKIIYSETDLIDDFIPDLAFRGMKIIYERNKKAVV